MHRGLAKDIRRIEPDRREVRLIWGIRMNFRLDGDADIHACKDVNRRRVGQDVKLQLFTLECNAGL